MHPRSKETCCPQGKEILPDMVAEDFIASMLSSGKHVTVYSLSSSVLFTMADHPYLTKIIIRHSDVSLPSLYEKSSSYGIQVMDYDYLIKNAESMCTKFETSATGQPAWFLNCRRVSGFRSQRLGNVWLVWSVRVMWGQELDVLGLMWSDARGV